MTHLRRFAAFSILGFLAACGSSNSGEDSHGTEQGSGGTASGDDSTGTGTLSSVGGGGPTSGGTDATGNAQAATGNATTSTASSTEGTASTTSGTGGAGTTTSGTGGAGTTTSGRGGAGPTTSTMGDTTTGTGGTGTSATGAGGDTTRGTDSSSTTGMNPLGDLSITDPVPGFASVAGGTTGGGTDIGSAIVVNSMSQLQNAAGGSSPAIILVQPGNYSGKLAPGSNKTIIGTGPGVTLTGSISISGSDVSNVIIRNLAVRGEHCNTYDECKAGADGVYVGNGAHHVWLDHLDIADGQDGNCDITQGGDYVTVSWTYFHYTYDKEHRFSNLIAGSDDEPASVGKLHITYMDSHWGERVDQRQPRGRFGNIHMLNNYHNSGGSQIHGVGKDMALIAENCVYDEHISIWKDMGRSERLERDRQRRHCQ